MVKREIIKIDEELCTGCGECIPNCPEGALQIIDEKARIISDLFCDGLGACIGHCPEGAISIEEREAEKYEEKKVMENVVKQGENVIKAHLEHLKDHNQTEYLQQAIDYLKENDMKVPIEEKQKEAPLPCGCPGSAVMDLRDNQESSCVEESHKSKGVSQLKQWPVQIMLVPPNAPFLKDADLAIAADCVPFAYPDFHEDFMKGKALLVGCPKLDDAELYKNKIQKMFEINDIKSVTVPIMEVPCCHGLYQLVSEAIKDSGKDIPLKKHVIGIKGNLIDE